MILKNELFGIVSEEKADTGFAYTIQLNKEHFIFQAHFPGNPIMPGVCILQILTELLSLQMDRRMELQVVNNVKYISILSPEKHDTVDCIFSSPVMENSVCKVKAVIRNSEKFFAKTSLTYKYES